MCYPLRKANSSTESTNGKYSCLAPIASPSGKPIVSNASFCGTSTTPIGTSPSFLACFLVTGLVMYFNGASFLTVRYL